MIRAGAFPHVAAMACGVRQKTFESWLQQGNKPKAQKKYRQFVDAVSTAQGQARVRAEMAALQENPVSWLKSGPGKEEEALSGWTSPKPPVINQDNRSINVLLSPELQGLFAAILKILEPHPEARTAVAQAMAEDFQLNAPRLTYRHQDQS